jgi:hypothetical protein
MNTEDNPIDRLKRLADESISNDSSKRVDKLDKIYEKYPHLRKKESISDKRYGIEETTSEASINKPMSEANTIIGSTGSVGSLSSSGVVSSSSVGSVKSNELSVSKFRKKAESGSKKVNDVFSKGKTKRNRGVKKESNTKIPLRKVNANLNKKKKKKGGVRVKVYSQKKQYSKFLKITRKYFRKKFTDDDSLVLWVKGHWDNLVKYSSDDMSNITISYVRGLLRSEGRINKKTPKGKGVNSKPVMPDGYLNLSFEYYRDNDLFRQIALMDKKVVVWGKIFNGTSYLGGHIYDRSQRKPYNEFISYMNDDFYEGKRNNSPPVQIRFREVVLSDRKNDVWKVEVYTCNTVGNAVNINYGKEEIKQVISDGKLPDYVIEEIKKEKQKKADQIKPSSVDDIRSDIDKDKNDIDNQLLIEKEKTKQLEIQRDTKAIDLKLKAMDLLSKDKIDIAMFNKLIGN